MQEKNKMFERKACFPAKQIYSFVIRRSRISEMKRSAIGPCMAGRLSQSPFDIHRSRISEMKRSGIELAWLDGSPQSPFDIHRSRISEMKRSAIGPCMAGRLQYPRLLL